MAAQIRTQVTDWNECKGGPWYPSMSHGGFAAYRIWQQFDGMRWFQRHEWKRADGSLEMETWIPTGVTSWLPTSAPALIQEAA
ncbi:hypothetical protein E5S70_17525 [Ensifer adhaerens]|uniref:hypothetical protein n=1 Tax=Ensifer canadensis TaxID=555315 RepID=UPI00148F53E8|nr:hypothetical protein [Ensifer canadensis]NOV17854.1 hypothetical protein [Ensifer canadensis]